MRSATFGLDIGTQSIKAVWFDQNGNNLSLQACISIPAPARGMLSESLQDQEALAGAIQKVLTDANISVRAVHTALPDSQVYTKVLDMPIMSEKELSSAIYWEAEQYIPIPLSEVTLDWKILHQDTNVPTNPRMQVLLVAARIDVVKRYQAVLELAGLTAISVEPEVLSIIRPFTRYTNFPTSLFINIGAHSTSIAIVQGMVMVFAYAIPLGGNAINRAIATDFGISLPQAEEYKKTYGLSDKNLGSKIGQTIDPILSSLFAEVRKAISFYSDKYKANSPIQQVLLTGGSAKLPGLDLYFAQKSGIETVIANPWKILNASNVPPHILESGPDYNVAIGLALREYE